MKSPKPIPQEMWHLDDVGLAIAETAVYITRIPEEIEPGQGITFVKASREAQDWVNALETIVALSPYNLDTINEVLVSTKRYYKAEEYFSAVFHLRAWSIEWLSQNCNVSPQDSTQWERICSIYEGASHT